MDDRVQVVVLATGEREKLRPLTDLHPSPMLPVLGRPVLAYVVELCARYGLKRILVPLYRLAGEIEAGIGDGRRWGLHIEYALQRESLGSGGSLARLRYSLENTTLVLPGDSLLDLDIRAAWEQHRASGYPMTVVVSACGLTPRQPVGVGSGGRVELPGSTANDGPILCDTGAYFIEPYLLERIPSDARFDLHADLLPALLAEDVPVGAYLHKGCWNPLETLLELHTAQKDMLSNGWDGNYGGDMGMAGALFRVPGRSLEPGIWVGRNTSIHPSASLAPPVWVGENSRIGKRVELGSGAIVGSNVVVDEGASIRESLVLDRTYVGRLVDIAHRTVDRDLMVDNPTGEHVRIRDGLLLGEVDDNSLAWRLTLIFEWGLACLLMIIGLPLFLAAASLALLASGRVFDSVEIVRTLPSEVAGSPHGPRIVRVLRFATSRGGGFRNSLGSWLKDWELDRLPELLSVVRGQITLVGVSMLSPEAAARFTEPWQMRREDWPTGFTGLWYTRLPADGSLDDFAVTDAYYVATRSFQTDLSLLLQTPIAWYRRVVQRRQPVRTSPQEHAVDGM